MVRYTGIALQQHTILASSNSARIHLTKVFQSDSLVSDLIPHDYLIEASKGGLELQRHSNPGQGVHLHAELGI